MSVLSRERIAAIAVILVAIVLAILFLVVPIVHWAKARDRIRRCQKNMKTLGELCSDYPFARRLIKNDKLREDFYIDLVFKKLEDLPHYLLCPATDDKVDETWHKAEKAPKFKTSPNNCSYFGPIDTEAHSKMFGADAGTPIGGEHWFNHAGGVNVLFGDTRVTFYTWEEFGLEKGEDVFGKDWSDTPSNLDLSLIAGFEFAEPSDSSKK